MQQTTTVDAETLADIARAGGDFTASDVPATTAAPVEAAPVDPQLAGMISGALLIVFGLLSKQRGDHWSLDQESAEEAGNAYAAVLLKYCPNIKTGPEVAAIMVTAMIVGPRVMMDKSKAEARALEESRGE